MSQKAGIYYKKRADLWDIEVPPILDGRPQSALNPGEDLELSAVIDGFCRLVRPVESFVIDGIPGVYEAQEKKLSARQWERIKDLPRSKSIRTLKQHAEKVVGPALSSVLALGSAVYIEALAPQEATNAIEATDAIWDRLAARSSSHTSESLRREESAQALLCSRVVDEEGCCTAALATLVWGRHFSDEHVPTKSGRPFRETLTPQYFSAPLL